MYSISEEIYEFTATITTEKYYNEDSCWGSYIFSTTDPIPYYTSEYTNVTEDTGKVQRICTLSGKMQQLQVGTSYSIKASYSMHPKYGHQYTPTVVYALLPKTKEQQLIFLNTITTGRISQSLIDAYPNIVEDVALGKIEEIDCSKVSGIGELSWQKIKSKILDNYIISDILVMLQPVGVSYAMIRKLLQNEPNPMLLKQNIENNPYVISTISGIGFKKADEFALKVKPELESSRTRLVAFINWYLRELGEGEGHTWVSKDILKSEISNYVPQCISEYDWVINNAEFLHTEGDKIGLNKYYTVEHKLLSYFLTKAKMHTFADVPEDIIQASIHEAEEEQGYTYSEEQLNVINSVLHSSISFITGIAGSGKTSVTRAILKAYQNGKRSIASCALSAMAAKRIEEASGYPASTIHRLLGCQGENRFLHNKDNPLLCSVVLIDEASMINAGLFLRLVEAIGDYTRIIICGDSKQLPPIGYGNIFSDMTERLGKSVVFKFTKPMRQALKSGVLADATIIRQQRNPVTETLTPKIVHGELQDMFYMFRNNRQQLCDIAINTYLKTIQKEGVDNVAIITPRRQGCINSSQEINAIIQEKLLGDEPQSISFGNKTFKLHARVMQIVNDYDKNVFNGEMGEVIEIGEREVGKKQKTEQYCKVNFADKGTVEYSLKEIDQLELSYAVTVHKIQGGSRKTIIGIIDNTHFKLLDNCLLYTLLTRAKTKCLLLAEPEAFLKCIRTNHNKRNTWLNEKGA